MQKQAPWTAIQETTSNLDIQCSTNGSSNTDELDMPGLEFSVSMIVSFFYTFSIWRVVREPIVGFEGSNHRSFTRASSNGFFVIARVSTNTSRQGSLIHHMGRHPLLSIEVVIPSARHSE